MERTNRLTQFERFAAVRESAELNSVRIIDQHISFTGSDNDSRLYRMPAKLKYIERSTSNFTTICAHARVESSDI
jgi:hypothetical protein